MIVRVDVDTLWPGVLALLGAFNEVRIGSVCYKLGRGGNVSVDRSRSWRGGVVPAFPKVAWRVKEARMLKCIFQERRRVKDFTTSAPNSRSKPTKFFVDQQNALQAALSFNEVPRHTITTLNWVIRENGRKDERLEAVPSTPTFSSTS